MEQNKLQLRPLLFFVEAITDMSLQDVYSIWRGEADAATQNLKAKTNDQLKWPSVR